VGEAGSSALGFAQAFKSQEGILHDEESTFVQFSNSYNTMQLAVMGWLGAVTIAAVILLLVIYKRFGRGLSEPPSITRFREEQLDPELFMGHNNCGFSKSSIVDLADPHPAGEKSTSVSIES